VQKIKYLLDTSAIIAYLTNEKEAEKVFKLAPKSAIPFVALSEFYYIVWKKKGRAEADNAYGLVKSWKFPFLQPTESIILTASRFKVVYKLGFADSYIASFAFNKDLILVTKDKDYKSLKNEIKILFLEGGSRR